jgi:small subunit ribosomal protein S4
MGEIKKKRSKFNRPKKRFDRERIDAENVIVRNYGLKNKREIWKAKAKIDKFRQRAKSLIGSEEDEKNKFFGKLNKMGILVKEISDVLGLTEEDYLKRRLQTVVFKKGLANTVKQARQLIVHKYVLVEGRVVNVPSFIVTKELEDKITVKPKKEKVLERIKESNENQEESE